MAVDNTHTKYLKGADKKAWNNYAEALKAQTKLENFMGGLKIPDLKEGEEFEVPVNKNKSNKSKNKASKWQNRTPPLSSLIWMMKS